MSTNLLYLVFIDKVPKQHNVFQTLLACLKCCGRGKEKGGQQPVHVEQL